MCVTLYKENQQKTHTHTHLGFNLASTLCSAPTLWRRRPVSVFLIPSRCWEAVRFSALVSDILHLSREAGQPCHSNVKHMWNRTGQSGPEQTSVHTLRTEQKAARTTLVVPTAFKDKQRCKKNKKIDRDARPERLLHQLLLVTIIQSLSHCF